MPFSQQSYTGQGIVQQNVTPRAGEIIGASLANMGQSIGSGIEKFAQRREERAELEKRQSGASKGMRDVLVNLGLMTKEQANSKGFEELLQISSAAPQLIAKQREQQQQSFLSNYAQAQQPQQVTEDVDFSPQLAQAQGELDRTVSANQFRPEFVYSQQDSTPPSSKLQQFYGQPGIADKLAGGAISAIKSLPANQGPEGFNFNPGLLPQGVSTTAARRGDDILMREEMRAMRKAQPTPQPASQPSPVTGPIGPEQMPPEPEEITSMRNKLAELKIQAAEGDTRTRPENQAEYQKRIQSFMVDQIKKNPAAASYIADQMMGQKLTPEAQLSYMKYQDDINARTIPGFGVAPSAQTAKDLRDLHSAYEQVDTGVTRLLEILDTPGKRTNLDLRAEANTITGMLTGALRVPITGPGAFSDSERAMIEKIVQNPTSLWGLDSTKRKALETLRSRIKGSRDSFAKSIGLQPGGDSTQTRMRYNPSTGKFE